MAELRRSGYEIRDAELADLRRQLGGGGMGLGPGGSVPADVRAAFERFDVNRSGKLDYRELRNALQAAGLDLRQVNAEELLRRHDAYQDGPN